jgi:protein-S-isoprenylcysteine O-methyltransferase Ste14
MADRRVRRLPVARHVETTLFKTFTATRLANLAGFVAYMALGIWTFLQVREISLFLLPTFLHELFIAVAFLIRDPARAGAPSMTARLTAYSGTFLVVLFFPIASRWDPSWLTVNAVLQLRAAGVLSWLVGAVLVLTGVWTLRRAFSIEPQARRLVTTGPYRYARHPIYALYFLQYAGLWLIFPTAALACVLAVWAGLMFARMHFEECVLMAAFPEYAAYQERVGRFAPRLRRRALPISTRPSTLEEPMANHA